MVACRAPKVSGAVASVPGPATCRQRQEPPQSVPGAGAGVPGAQKLQWGAGGGEVRGVGRCPCRPSARLLA